MIRRRPRLGLWLAITLAASSLRAQPAPATPPAPPLAPAPEAPVPPGPAPPEPNAPAVANPAPPAPVAPTAATPAAPGAGAEPEGPPPAPQEAPPAAPTPPSPPPAPPASEATPDEPEDSSWAEEGSLRYALDAIEVRGNDRTRARVVLRYVPFKPGDVIDVDDPKVELTRYRLLGTGFFRDVQLSLRKGKRRGHVILVIEVVERNTLVVNDLFMGLAADADTNGRARPLTTYAGIDAAETNLLGTGITLGGAIGIAQEQLALRLRFFDPAFLGSHWMTSASVLFNDANDFFGNDDVQFASLGANFATSAVVQYERLGGALGLGRDLSVSTQLWTQYRLEAIDANVPVYASHRRGNRREPIDFHVIDGQSVLSTVSATLQHDTRDKPILPSRGWFASVTTELSPAPLGSDYPYTRVDALASRHFTLPWKHVMRLRLFGGAIAGDAPFFERYYVGDLSDFRAGRVLGLNVERRPAPNFFGTTVAEVKFGNYAARFDTEYRIPLYRGSRSVFGIDIFARAGLFAIAGQEDIDRPAGGYSGAALFPIDFTANLGVQMDTVAGGFTFALANVVGFLPALSEDP